jgi:PAS domain S-box-containing protein
MKPAANEDPLGSFQFGVFEQAALGVVLSDSSGVILRCNQAMAALLGCTREELEGRSWTSVTHPEDVELSTSALRSLERGEGRALRIRKRYLTQDGRVIWADLSLAGFEDAAGRWLTLAFVQDVTEAVWAADAARSSAERLNLILELASDGVWEWDLETGRLYVSPGWRAVTGWPADAPSPDAVAWQAMLHAEDAETLAQKFARLMAGELKTFSSEYRIQGEFGVRYVQDQGRVLREGPAGEPLSLIGTVKDVTGLRAAQEELHQSQKMDSLGRLAGGVAHDFNNLLTAILGNVSLAQAEASGGVGEALSQIESAAVSAAALTTRLLAFCRKQSLVQRIVNVSALLAKTESMLRRVLGPRYVLRLEVHAPEAVILVDPSQAEQAIINLVLNARDAMPEGGEIVVTVSEVASLASRARFRAPGPFIAVAVADQGRGLTDTEKSHLFEPFYTTKPCGTGLGLATVYGLMEQLGGGVDVSSQWGHGSTFWLYFPMHSAPAAEAASFAAPQAWVRGKEHLVLVDDDAAVRNVVEKSLVTLGYRVTAFDGATKALAALPKLGPVELLITDVVMPQVSGPQLAARVRAERPSLRVLFISGYSADFARSSLAEDARARFLAKPFLPAELARAVRELLLVDV